MSKDDVWARCRWRAASSRARPRMMVIATALLVGGLWAGLSMPVSAQDSCEVAPAMVGSSQPGKSGQFHGSARGGKNGATTQSLCPEPPPYEPGPPPPPEGPVERDAMYYSQSVPTTMVVGQSYNVSVQMRNTGTATWTSADGYKLGSQNPQDNWIWGLNRVGVSGSVRTNEVATFNFAVRAPTTPGTHYFVWRMVDEGLGWFGTWTPAVAVNVQASAVKGAIEGASSSVITGWACSAKINSPIDVYLYVDGAAGTGAYLGSYRADQSSEPAVAAACETQGTAYRFSIPITAEMVVAHGGKTIYVHGISPVGASNNLLSNAGTYRLPSNAAPSATLTAPSAGQVFQLGDTVNLAANASDPDGNLQKVQFLVDGVVVAEDMVAPFAHVWTGLEGVHALAVRAYDSYGVNTTSSSTQITVSGRPWVNLTSPGNGITATAPATLQLAADAGDVDGVASVQFLINGAVLATDTSAPYAFTWSNIGVGSYNVQAKVTDRLGEVGTSAVATLTVQSQSAGVSLISRVYVYDQHQRLCKVIEPETGTTVMDYDAAGNLAWSAAGLNLPDPSDSSCAGDRATAYGSGRRVDRTYDGRSRLTALRFPDGRGNQDWSYTPDGLPDRITTYNAPSGGEPVVNTYSYNKRRLLVGEAVEQVGWYTWSSGYGYNANGHLSVQTFPPTGLSVDYAPNALGQATRAGSYATGVSYYPNGAVKQFTYGNGVVHTMTQNARQLPQWSIDTGVINYEASFDANGNATAILDHVRGVGYSRWMGYDNADRLTSAGSASFGGDHWHRFTYDALDNLKSWTLGGVKDQFYYYDPSRNQLNNVNTSTGATIVSLEYDAQGNLKSRDSQDYDYDYGFDYGNRLREVTGKEYYRYDGHGRRVLAWSPSSGSILSQYSQNGQLVFQQDQRENKNIDHIYLAGSLVATSERNLSTGVVSVRYQHTDALGSPVAVSNESAQVVERTQFEPFGAAIGKTVQGVGYTGHVMDAATGLTYMQQRYYDPTIGRFLSVDPVTADGNTGSNFNRYWYANNNPYKFTDPDGRYWCTGGPQQCAALDGFIATMRFGLTRMDPGGAAFRRLSEISDLLGNAWQKNGVTIDPSPIPGDAYGTAGANGAIGIDVEQMSEIASDLKAHNPSLALGEIVAGVGAGAVAHEGSHTLDWRTRGSPSSEEAEYATESSAYRIQSRLDQALKITTGINWPGMTEAQRQSQIDAGARKSTESWCEKRAEGC